MKHVVMMGESRGSDIRPPALLARFRELSLTDAQTFFGHAEALVETPCPACETDIRIRTFEKHGFAYHECGDCRTLYVSPRPSAGALVAYYNESEAARFRTDYMTAETTERTHMLRNRALWVAQLLDEADLARPLVIADLGTAYPRLIQEMQSLRLFERIYSVAPFAAVHLDTIRARATVTSESPSGLSAITAFEQLEHQSSVREFIARAFDMLAPGGLLFLTTRTCRGFDMQVLDEHTPYIFVPEHLNLLSIEGLEHLLQAIGFELLEVSTPGQLDVSLIEQAVQEDPTIPLPPFVDYLLNHRPRRAHEEFQEFLQRNRLSSHLRMAAIKPKE